MSEKKKQGFASFSPEKMKMVASMGGRSQSKDINPGNFANNRERAAAAGRKGGTASKRKK